MNNDFAFDLRISQIKQSLAATFINLANKATLHKSLLEDIIRTSAMLDIAHPVPVKRGEAATPDNLLEMVVQQGGFVVNTINPTKVLFDENRPFTCMSLVVEILTNTAAKINTFAANSVVTPNTDPAAVSFTRLAKSTAKVLENLAKDETLVAAIHTKVAFIEAERQKAKSNLPLRAA